MEGKGVGVLISVGDGCKVIVGCIVGNTEATLVGLAVG